MRRDLRGAVVVITGGSSGIGRATARAFARRGSRVVLTARRADMLADAVRECRAAGVDAFAVPADVAHQSEVSRVAEEAIRVLGGIDVWVNNAGVMMFGRFEETPAEDWRRVVETNLFGYVHGVRAVLPHFLEKGRGTIINNASIVAEIGQPLSSAYVVSKFAVRGLTVALRQELLDRPGIAVCSVLPSSIDTPLWQHTANHTGHAFHALRPVYDPEQVAAAIVRLAERPQRELVVGTMGKVMTLQHRLLPGLTERLMARAAKATVFEKRPEPEHSGNLHRPLPDGLRAHGGWRPERRTRLGRWALAALPLAALCVVGGRSLRRAIV